VADVVAGMHDHPGLYPTLPSREPDDFARDLLAHDQGEWRTCWEYVLTHRLSDAEGSAFWHGANLAAIAFGKPPAAVPADGAGETRGGR
jgi:hypothetical protein